MIPLFVKTGANESEEARIEAEVAEDSEGRRYIGSGEDRPFKLTHYHLFNLCRSLPLQQHSDVLKFVLAVILEDY